MEKDFDRWNEQKKAVDRTRFTPFVHMREVWWCSLGVNIGAEENGNDEFDHHELRNVRRKLDRVKRAIVPRRAEYFKFVRISDVAEGIEWFVF